MYQFEIDSPKENMCAQHTSQWYAILYATMLVSPQALTENFLGCCSGKARRARLLMTRAGLLHLSGGKVPPTARDRTKVAHT